jgi:iron(III) transport system ATP-binding protein
LAVRGLVVRLGRREVLSGLDLDVPAGRATVLLGRSGSGKTTLLRAVAGLLDPDAGTIEVGGRVVANPSPVIAAERRGIGMVFQTLELFPHLTVAENLAFGLPGRPRGRAAARVARVREVAALVGIEPLLARRPPTLSGGERQRTAIARAIAPSPAAVLYDEPLASLDPERREDLRVLLRAVRRATNATTLHVTHDAEEALEMGEEVAVLDAGRVVDRGPPERVYRRPACAAAARALGPVAFLPVRRVQSADGRAAFETPLGPVAADDGRGDDRPAEGFVALRPEHVALAGDGPAPQGGAGARAVVASSSPRGDGWAFLATLEDGTRVSGRADARPSDGTAVRLVLRGDPAVLPPEPSLLARTKGAA